MAAAVPASRVARILAALPLLATALSGCTALGSHRIANGEAAILVGPPVRDNRTPLDPALACLGQALAMPGKRPLVIAVGDVRDYTGKYSVNEGNAITQGGSLMVASAIGKLGGSVRLAERFDPSIAERELGYTDKRQLGDGKIHDLASPQGKQSVAWLPYYGGTIAASDYYIVGGITELNYDLRSGGAQLAIDSIGPRARSYTQSVAVDLRIVDTHSLLVVGTVSLTKQFTGYETGFGIFRFFGSSLFDINLGEKAQEPLQLGIRAALEEATIRLVASAAQVDPRSCLAAATWHAAAGVQAAGRLVPADTTAVAGEGAQLMLADKETTPTGSAETLTIVFPVGSGDLPAEALALVEKVLAAPGHAIDLMLAARDSENLDPAARDSLTDRRLASLVAALGQHGLGPSALTVIRRTANSQSAAPTGGAGLRELALVRLAH